MGSTIGIMPSVQSHTLIIPDLQGQQLHNMLAKGRQPLMLIYVLSVNAVVKHCQFDSTKQANDQAVKLEITQAFQRTNTKIYN